jgi:hypothetical protein
MGPRQPSAHALGLGQVEQGKAVGAAQAFIRALDAVAVGVGLDDGPQARAWGGGAQARQVVAQRAGVDGGLDGAGHGGGWTMADGRRFWHPPACVWVRIMRARARAITRHLARLRIVVVPSHFRSPTPIPMKRGFYTIMAAQFFSSLADNALFVAAVEMLRRSGATDWQRPRWCPCSRCSTCCWRPGWRLRRLAAQGQGDVLSNAIKVVGCLMMLFGGHPLLAYAVVGLGAAAYSPAKYGILTELLPPSQLVKANGWIEG